MMSFIVSFLLVNKLVSSFIYKYVLGNTCVLFLLLSYWRRLVPSHICVLSAELKLGA